MRATIFSMRHRRVLWRRAVNPTRRFSRLRARPGGFSVIVVPLSTSAFDGLATGELLPPGLLRGLLSDEVDFICRRPRVAARPLRAVTPARKSAHRRTPEWVSRGPKALRGVSKGAAPLWRESRGQRPLVGFQRAKPFGGVQGQSPWRRHFERIFLRNDCKMREDGV